MKAGFQLFVNRITVWPTSLPHDSVLNQHCTDQYAALLGVFF
jgi:hypothetical protein